MQTRKRQITLRETIVQVSSLSLNHSRLLEALSIGRMKEVLINRLFAYCISTLTPAYLSISMKAPRSLP